VEALQGLSAEDKRSKPTTVEGCCRAGGDRQSGRPMRIVPLLNDAKAAAPAALGYRGTRQRLIRILQLRPRPLARQRDKEDASKRGDVSGIWPSIFALTKGNRNGFPGVISTRPPNPAAFVQNGKQPFGMSRLTP